MAFIKNDTDGGVQTAFLTLYMPERAEMICFHPKDSTIVDVEKYDLI